MQEFKYNALTAAGDRLNSLQNWRMCAMWRKQQSLTSIGASVGISEEELHEYIYTLIKRDATASEGTSH